MSFTLLETPLVGLEDLQRAAFYVLLEGMNNALTEIADYWAPRDVIFDTRVGTTLAPTTLEAIPSRNFHEGHKPSLLQGTPEDYPNVSVFAMTANAAPESAAMDQYNSWLDMMLVEVMVKATNEDTCNRRIQRTAEAVVMSLLRNPNLGGATYGLKEQPTILISDLFAVRSASQGGAYPGQPGKGGVHSGMRYVWQGAAIRFQVQKESSPPFSGPGTFAGASTVDYSTHIDQG